MPAADRPEPHLVNIEELIAGHGDITIGSMDPLGCLATAADRDVCYAMLARRPDESLLDLLRRLNQAISDAINTGTTIDDVNPTDANPLIRP